MRGSWQNITTMSFNPGDGLILTAVICYALYVSLLRLRPAIHPISFLAITFVLGTVMLLHAPNLWSSCINNFLFQEVFCSPQVFATQPSRDFLPILPEISRG
jgi:drug/metabolite transporter (DMT)-like permease